MTIERKDEHRGGRGTLTKIVGIVVVLWFGPRMAGHASENIFVRALIVAACMAAWWYVYEGARSVLDRRRTRPDGDSSRV